MKSQTYFTKLIRGLRREMMHILVPKETHHIGCSLSILDILVYLYFEKLQVNPKNPKDPNRDIFILSKGHGALALYMVLYKKGFFNKEYLQTFEQEGGNLPEHASSLVPGVELSTGSLGHGLSVGIGYATSFANDKKKNKLYVLISDGELNEGSNWEAIMYAGHHHLSNLIAIVDLNGFQGYSETKKVIDLNPLAKKLSIFGWNTYRADGHDLESLNKAFAEIEKTNNNKPHCIIAKTVKGKGIPYFEGKFESHYKSLNEDQIQEILKTL